MVHTFVCVCILCGQRQSKDSRWLSQSYYRLLHLVALIQGLSLGQKLALLATLTDQRALWTHLCMLSSVGVTRYLHHTQLFMWVLGIQTQLLVFRWQEGILSHLPRLLYCLYYVSSC